MSPVTIDILPHPTLAVAAFITELPTVLEHMPVHGEITAYLTLHPEKAPPLQADETVRNAIRDLLRVGGYRPSGRAKPSSEYLARAAAQTGLSSINVLVDACNVTSLHSGLPISVIDLDRAKSPFAIGIVEGPMHYVFNASGQEIDLKGLLCLHDGDGPCANPVKDAQRTKTSPTTRRTLSVIWGAQATRTQTQAACAWYRELLAGQRAQTTTVI